MQVFIRIIFRSIGLQEKHFNFILVLFQPGRSKLAVMDFQIVLLTAESILTLCRFVSTGSMGGRPFRKKPRSTISQLLTPVLSAQ